MQSIKGKILVIYAFFALCLIGLGVYSWRSSQQLTRRIAELLKPNEKARLFNELATDLNKFTTVYLQYAGEAEAMTDTTRDDLLADIEATIAELKATYKRPDGPSGTRLDSIPDLLRQIEREYLALQKLRRQAQRSLYGDLEAELKEKLTALGFQDSVQVMQETAAELARMKADTLLTDVETKAQAAAEEARKQGFLRKLTQRFRREKARIDSAVVAEARASADAQTAASDSLFQTQLEAQVEEATAGLVRSVESTFSNIYEQEMRAQRNLRRREMALYETNAAIVSDIERMVNDFRLEQALVMQASTEETYRYSQTFINILTGIILAFVVISLGLLLLTLRDLNRNRYYQHELLRREEMARRQAKAKQHFLATMSHELRTPLTSIIGYADLLEGKETHAQAIKASSRYLLQIANEILDLAKIEAGIIEVREQPVDATAILAELRLNFEEQIRQQGIEPIFELPPDPVYVRTDPYRLQQVIYNLMHNAIKFTDAGFIRLSAQASTTEKGQVRLHVAVADSGVGIAAQEQKHIFENYQQAGTHKEKAKGTGLGLGIVKEVVKQLGGQMTLRSQLQKGTTFTLDFYLTPSEPVAPAESATAWGPEALRGKSIFAVDDDPLITKLYEQMLRTHGARLETRNDPQAALDHLQSHTYDLVITDIKMPGLTGHELLARLCAADRRPPRIAASTANVFLSEEDQKALKAFDAVIIKPVSKRQLLAKVAELLEVSADGAPSAPARSNEASAAVAPPKPVYDLTELREYAMDDEETLLELIEMLYEENQQELAQATAALDERRWKQVGEHIHKLASRFRQIRAEAPFDVKQMERSFLNGSDVPVGEGTALLAFWAQVNTQLYDDLLAARPNA